MNNGYIIIDTYLNMIRPLANNGYINTDIYLDMIESLMIFVTYSVFQGQSPPSNVANGYDIVVVC